MAITETRHPIMVEVEEVEEAVEKVVLDNAKLEQTIQTCTKLSAKVKERPYHVPQRKKTLLRVGYVQRVVHPKVITHKLNVDLEFKHFK